MTHCNLKKIAACVLTVLVACVPACTRGSNDSDTIRIGYLQSDLHHLPAFVALEKGMYEDEDLQVTIGGIFKAGPEQMSAFAAGELDAGYVGLAPAATATLNGVADITILSQVNTEGSAVVCRPGTGSLEKLRGKTVAIPGHATMQDCLIQKGVRSAGLVPKELRLMVLKPPEMLPALEAGTIDCFIAWEPYPTQAAELGNAEVAARSNELWQEHPCCVLIAQTDFVQNRPADSAALIRAHRRACRFIAENPDEALAIAVRYTGMPQNIVLRAMQHIDYTPDMSREKAEGFAAFLSELNYLSPVGKGKDLQFFNKD